MTPTLKVLGSAVACAAILMSSCSSEVPSSEDGVVDVSGETSDHRGSDGNRSRPDRSRRPSPATDPTAAPTTTTTPVTTVPAAVPPPATGAQWWTPAAGDSWQWQLTGNLDLSVDVDVYDVDLEDTSAAEVESLHAAGRRVICYMSAGTWEPWRADEALLTPAVRGSSVSGFDDERWLDIRRLDVILPVMAARMDACRAKGFDGVEPDNVDAFTNPSGFPLTATDQLVYNREIARLAHERGLAVGLKNDVDQVADLVGSFDFAVNEECFAYDECETLRPFIAAGKPVFHAEYDLATSEFCGEALALGFSSQRKRIDLDAWRQAC